MNKIKILIVDDRPENLLVLESLIDDPCVELVKANSGDMALAAMFDHDFALVLLDVHMPGMNGYEVAELMRSSKKTRNIPIIFVTAEHKEKAQIFKGYDAGAVDYLFKPLEPIILKGKVGVFLELFAQRNELKRKTEELDSRLCELEELQQQLEETNEQLKLSSRKDGLTNLANRRYFDEVYSKEWQRSLRFGEELSVLLIDVDNFKSYNDQFGHLAGDDALREVATVLTKGIQRDVDIVARYGGEEFVVILPNTSLCGAEKVAGNIRRNIAGCNIEHPANEPSCTLTVSVGVATMRPQQGVDSAKLLNEADINLYKAKNGGRNRWISSCEDLKKHVEIVSH